MRVAGGGGRPGSESTASVLIGGIWECALLRSAAKLWAAPRILSKSGGGGRTQGRDMGKARTYLARPWRLFVTPNRDEGSKVGSRGYSRPVSAGAHRPKITRGVSPRSPEPQGDRRLPTILLCGHPGRYLPGSGDGSLLLRREHPVGGVADGLRPDRFPDVEVDRRVLPGLVG